MLLLNAVQSGQADGIIAGMSVTDARKETFDFSDSTIQQILFLVLKNQALFLLMKI